MILFRTWMDEEHEKRTKLLVMEVKALEERALGEDLEELVEQLASGYHYPDTPEVLADDYWREEREFQEGKSETSVRVHIPFRGDATMFRMCDESRPTSGSEFEIIDNGLVRTYVVHRDEIDALTGSIQGDIAFVKEWLERVRPAIPHHNRLLRERARNEIEQRRREIGIRNDATKRLENLGIPIRKRNDGMERIVLPVELERKSIPIPKKHTVQKEAHHFLEMQAYDDILDTISAMVHVMERSPSVFATMGEEHLRTVLLVALNGIYKGQATGETFNGYGKSDILIRVEDKNVFLAECLVWDGPDGLQSKMDDQLFTKYAMWRDTKLALIVFNRNRDFTHVIDEMKKTVKQHKQCVQELPYRHDSGSRYKFRRHDDPQQHFTLTCLAFDVPSKK